MKVTIKSDVDWKDEEVDIEVDNENMDNPNYVDIIIEGKGYTVSIEDLYYAIMPFFIIKMDRKEE